VKHLHSNTLKLAKFCTIEAKYSFLYRNLLSAQPVIVLGRNGMFLNESETLKWYTSNKQLHGQRKLSSLSSVDNRFSLSVIIPTRNEAGNIIP
jgi:hypothetical protein